MKSWVVALTLMVVFPAGVGATAQCDVDFKLEQLWTMQMAYDRGVETDRGYTLAAITWQESSAGLKLRRKDGEHWAMRSYGPFHILLKTASKRRDCLTWNCGHIKRKLLTDFNYSADLALEELDYWTDRLSSRRKALAAYNAGNNWNGSKGMNYLSQINKKVSYLQKCVRF